MRPPYLFLVGLFLANLSFGQRAGLSKQFINPGAGYSNVVIAQSDGVKTIHVAGQVGEGNNLEAQLRSAFANLEKQLTDAGAKLSDMVKMTTYIVRYKESDLEVFRRVRGEILSFPNPPANTLVGVYSLFRDQYLVEIEATAVVEQ